MVTRASFDPVSQSMLVGDEISTVRQERASSEGQRERSLAVPTSFMKLAPLRASAADVLETPDPIMATAKKVGGSAIVGRDAGPNDLVRFKGVQMQLRIAESMGLVTRQPGGSYRSTSAREGNAPGSSQEGDLAPRGPAQSSPALPSGQLQGADQVAYGEPTGVPLSVSDETSQAFDGIRSAASGWSVSAALSDVALKGEVSPQSLGMLASDMNMEPEEMAAKVASIHQGYYDAVTTRMGGLGVYDEDVFSDWVAQDSRLGRDLRQAVQRLAADGDADGFDALAHRFVTGLDKVAPDDVKDALAASRIDHRQAQDGTILLYLPGRGEVTYADAVRRGLIKVSKR